MESREPQNNTCMPRLGCSPVFSSKLFELTACLSYVQKVEGKLNISLGELYYLGVQDSRLDACKGNNFLTRLIKM